MDEGVAERVPVLVDQQQVVLPGGAQAGVEDVGGDLDGGGQETVADPAAADGGGTDDLLGALVEAIEAGEQQLVENRRHVPVAGHGGQLLGEERIAVGPFEHGAHQPIRRLRAEDAAQLLGDVAGTERRQAQVVDTVGPLELGEQPTHRIATLEIVGAVRRHQQHAWKLRAAGEDREQVAGRSVGPVDVLDDEHHRPLAGQPAQCRRQRLRRPSAVAGVVTELGEHLVHRRVRCSHRRRRRGSDR